MTVISWNLIKIVATTSTYSVFVSRASTNIILPMVYTRVKIIVKLRFISIALTGNNSQGAKG